jgi:hypothetical protein
MHVTMAVMLAQGDWPPEVEMNAELELWLARHVVGSWRSR